MCTQRGRRRTSTRSPRLSKRSPTRLTTEVPERARQLALRRGARRRLGRRPRVAAAPPARNARRDRVADRDVPLSRPSRAPDCAERAGQPPAATHRRDRHLGSGRATRERRPRNEDRDPRRRDRPDAPVLRRDRLLVSAAFPEGERGLHDAEGDCRARVPVAVDALEERRQAVRPQLLRSRDPRRRHRRRRLRHADRHPRRRHCLGHRAEGVSRQLQGAHRPD